MERRAIPSEHERSAPRRWPAMALLFLGAAEALGCASKSAPESAPCEEKCQDGTALRALREMMKLGYNLTVQGRPPGEQNATTPCPLGGAARIAGRATADGDLGITNVDLVYSFAACGYLQVDTNPARAYRVTVSGAVAQSGIIAVQPSATTALGMTSDAVTIAGTVYDPPIDYEAADCALRIRQDGNNVSGELCGRAAGFGF